MKTGTFAHFDSSEERLSARQEIVDGDTPRVPPKYHFLIVLTTLAFSTVIFESSFPSVVKLICSRESP